MLQEARASLAERLREIREEKYLLRAIQEVSHNYNGWWDFFAPCPPLDRASAPPQPGDEFGINGWSNRWQDLARLEATLTGTISDVARDLCILLARSKRHLQEHPELEAVQAVASCGEAGLYDTHVGEAFALEHLHPGTELWDRVLNLSTVRRLVSVHVSLFKNAIRPWITRPPDEFIRWTGATFIDKELLGYRIPAGFLTGEPRQLGTWLDMVADVGDVPDPVRRAQVRFYTCRGIEAFNDAAKGFLNLLALSASICELVHHPDVRNFLRTSGYAFGLGEFLLKLPRLWTLASRFEPSFFSKLFGRASAGIGAAVEVWDFSTSLARDDRDAAAFHAVAAVGLTLTVVPGPWEVIGVAIALIGVIGAALTQDDELQQWALHCIHGREASLRQLRNQQERLGLGDRSQVQDDRSAPTVHGRMPPMTPSQRREAARVAEQETLDHFRVPTARESLAALQRLLATPNRRAPSSERMTMRARTVPHARR